MYWMKADTPAASGLYVGWLGARGLKTGIILGGTLELMALGWMNVGLAMAPDTAIASVISTILVITADQGIGEGLLSLLL